MCGHPIRRRRDHRGQARLEPDFPRPDTRASPTAYHALEAVTNARPAPSRPRRSIIAPGRTIALPTKRRQWRGRCFVTTHLGSPLTAAGTTLSCSHRRGAGDRNGDPQAEVGERPVAIDEQTRSPRRWRALFNATRAGGRRCVRRVITTDEEQAYRPRHVLAVAIVAVYGHR